MAPLWGHGFTKTKAMQDCDNVGAYFSAYLGDMPLDEIMALPEEERKKAIAGNEILEKESETVKFQESIFGNEGTMMKKRIELIQPIQERVFKAIEAYAKENGFDMVLDIASNATMLYYSPKVDRTEAVIKLVK